MIDKNAAITRADIKIERDRAVEKNFSLACLVLVDDCSFSVAPSI
jgi:hypothetical protein